MLAFSANGIFAQEIGVFNAKQKKIYKIKAGRSIDFRIDYALIYPERKDSTLEVRMYGLVDTIYGTKIHLIENQIIIKYTKTETTLVETDYEYTELTVDLGDIKTMSFNTAGASIGNAMLSIGIAAIIASPLLGINPGGYSWERVAQTAAIGLGTAAVGGGLTLLFGQKPVKFKDFDGPEYFKKYQAGSLSVLE